MVAPRLRAAVTNTRRRPALLAICGFVGLAEVGTWLLVGPFLATASGVGILAALLAQRLALLAVLAHLLPACYATLRGELDAADVGGGFRTALGRARTDGRRVLLSMVVSRAVALSLTLAVVLVLVGVLGVVDTAVVWIGAYAGIGTDRGLLALGWIAGSVLLASTLARGAVGLHDVRAIEADESWRAATWSLRAWRSRPRRLPAYALVRGSLLSLPVVAASLVLVVASGSTSLSAAVAPVALVDAVSPFALALAAVAFVAVTSATRATLASYQLDAYDRSIDDADDPTPPTTDSVASSVPRSRRVAIAAMVLVAAIGGAAAVRVADVHPELDDDPGALAPENAEATIETAVERTVARDRFVDQRTEVWNASTERWDRRNGFQVMFDRTDREVRFYGNLERGENRPDRTVYATDGRFAMLRVPEPPAPPAPYHVTVERGSWTVLVGPPYGWAIEGRHGQPPADAGWRLDEVATDRIVYRLDGSDALASDDVRELLGVPAGASVTVHDESVVTLAVDRRTLTIERIDARLAYDEVRADGGTRTVDLRVERRVDRVGDVDAKRPGSVGEPSPLALLWDAVYY